MVSMQLMVAAGGFALLFIVIIVLVLLLLKAKKSGSSGKPKSNQPINEIALEESGGLFNKEFHEELRNRGRLHFEKIITENAMFLKQDLDMTIAQMNEYLKKEINSKLSEEFADYAKAMKEAQELALESLHKSASAVEEQRVVLIDTLKKDIAEREAQAVQVYEANMARIVEHYIMEALGDQFDVKSQLPFIMAQMEANKQKIVEDMRL